MKRPLSRPKFTYANVIATVALFLALGGGAYAATSIPRNSIGSMQLKKNSVTSAKVQDGSLLASDFGSGQIPAGPQGPQGERGAKGDRGASGAQGAPGDDGDRGPGGERGLTGQAGLRGERGPTGPAGEDGTDGFRGPRGESGQRGERGLKGEPGEEGPQGEPGTAETTTRFGDEVRIGRGPLASYAACQRGEYVTGGGFGFTGAPEAGVAYRVRADQPSVAEEISEEELEEREREERLGEEGEVFGEGERGETLIYRAAPDGTTKATGWAVSLEYSGKELGKAAYRAYVECSAP